MLGCGVALPQPTLATLSEDIKVTVYAFWNNKGGVGKSFLSFVSACEYSRLNPDKDIYVIDLCPQANLSETLLGGQREGAKNLSDILRDTPRNSVGGYLEYRLNNPFSSAFNAIDYCVDVSSFNNKVPKNLTLVAGDNLVEILAEAIRQTSQLLVPQDAWKKVTLWIKDLINGLKEYSGDRDSVFFIDCNPSFSIYTQLALAASDFLVVPFTADESSRRAIENIFALLYGQGDSYLTNFSRLSFYKKAKEDGLSVPLLHTFISNRNSLYDGKPSKAFLAASKAVISTASGLYAANKHFFANNKETIDKKFIDFPDYHAVCIVSSLEGIPIHKMKAGPTEINGERIQINVGPLQKYQESLNKLVAAL
jgi:cellulose biosynthesis protein BcsQ